MAEINEDKTTVDREKTTIEDRRGADRTEHKAIIDRLDKIEHGYMEMGRTIIKLEATVEGFEKLVDRFENVLDRMSGTLGELNTTITKINSRVETNTGHLENIDGRIDNVDVKISVIDNKGKIDFLQILKDNFGKFFFGGTALAIAIYWIDHIVDSYMVAKSIAP